MHFPKFLSTIMTATACVLAGCASMDPVPTPDLAELKPVSDDSRSFVLGDRLDFSEKVGLAGVVWHMALEPGRYVAVQENVSGTFFKGPTRCVSFVHRDGVRYASGGVWIPKNRTQLPQLYWHLYMDQIDYPDRGTANRKSGGKPLMASADSDTLSTDLATNPGLTSASPGTAGAGAGVATGMIQVLIERDMKDQRGKPGFFPPLHSAELGRIRETLATSR